MKVLVDMNLSPAWATFLCAAGFEATHWSDFGTPSATDTEVMDWALQNRHIILTADLDFGAILAAGKKTRPSVVQVRSDILTPSLIGRIIVQALRQAEE